LRHWDADTSAINQQGKYPFDILRGVEKPKICKFYACKLLNLLIAKLQKTPFLDFFSLSINLHSLDIWFFDKYQRF